MKRDAGTSFTRDKEFNHVSSFSEASPNLDFGYTS